MAGHIVLRSSQNEVLLREINEKLDERTREVHLSIRPTINIIASILTAAPNIKLITCPPSLFERTPKKIKEALAKIKVDFKPLLLTPGRPRMHDDGKIRGIYRLKKKGFSAKKISKELGIPLTTVYYYLSKEQVK
ncbi:MAG: DUF1699 domain-containing protein [Methanobacteriota archaeon]|nr:MAG: DUF1699 domain-containing protein [Euryarchaeota archaeon]